MTKNYSMRLDKREIKDLKIIAKVLKDCHVINIAFPSKKYPYIIPMLYGYEYNPLTNNLVLYIHGANNGRKNDLIEDGNTQIGFEINNGGTFLPSVTGLANDNTRLYKSIIGYGDITPVNNVKDKEKAQELLLVHETGHEWDIQKKAIDFVTVYKIDVISFTGKQHRFSDYNGKILNIPSNY